MFNVGWVEMLVLIVAGLFVFGPERLPGAVATFARGVRQVREYASGAKEQLRAEMGPEFDELQKPLKELGKLRTTSPKQALARHLFADLDKPSTAQRKTPAPVELTKQQAPATDAGTGPARFDSDAT